MCGTSHPNRLRLPALVLTWWRRQWSPRSPLCHLIMIFSHTIVLIRAQHTNWIRYCWLFVRHTTAACHVWVQMIAVDERASPENFISRWMRIVLFRKNPFTAWGKWRPCLIPFGYRVPHSHSHTPIKWVAIITAMYEQRTRAHTHSCTWFVHCAAEMSLLLLIIISKLTKTDKRQMVYHDAVRLICSITARLIFLSLFLAISLFCLVLLGELEPFRSY